MLKVTHKKVQLAIGILLAAVGLSTLVGADLAAQAAAFPVRLSVTLCFLFVIAFGSCIVHVLNAMLNISLFEHVLGRYRMDRTVSTGLLLLSLELFHSSRQNKKGRA